MQHSIVAQQIMLYLMTYTVGFGDLGFGEMVRSRTDLFVKAKLCSVFIQHNQLEHWQQISRVATQRPS